MSFIIVSIKHFVWNELSDSIKCYLNWIMIEIALKPFLCNFIKGMVFFLPVSKIGPIYIKWFIAALS